MAERQKKALRCPPADQPCWPSFGHQSQSTRCRCESMQRECTPPSRARAQWQTDASAFMPTELAPSHPVRVISSESSHPSHLVRVISSESSRPSHPVRVIPSESSLPSHPFRSISSESVRSGAGRGPAGLTTAGTCPCSPAGPRRQCREHALSTRTGPARVWSMYYSGPGPRVGPRRRWSEAMTRPADETGAGRMVRGVSVSSGAELQSVLREQREEVTGRYAALFLVSSSPGSGRTGPTRLRVGGGMRGASRSSPDGPGRRCRACRRHGAAHPVKGP